MDEKLRKLQKNLLSEWGNLEEQVTKLDLWMAENGHIVTEASSFQTRQLFTKRKFGVEDIQCKIFEVVDELQLHKERILVQIKQFSEIGIKFKEFGNEDQDNISKVGNIPEVKIEVDPEDAQEIFDLLQDPLGDQLPENSEEESDNEFYPSACGGQDNKLKKQTAQMTSKGFLCRKKCGDRFTTKERLDRHEAHCRRNPFVKCSICSKTIKRKSLVNHMKLVHNIKQNLSTIAIKTATVSSDAKWNIPVQCPICSKTIKLSSMLDYHIRTSHGTDRKPPKSPKRKPPKAVISALGSKPFPCSHCSKTFATNEMLSYHMRAVQGERPYVCRKGCKASFISASHRCRHEKFCTGEPTSRRGRKPVYAGSPTMTGAVIDNDVGTGTQQERPFVCRKNCIARFIKSSHRNRHEQGCMGQVTSRRGRKPVY